MSNFELRNTIETLFKRIGNNLKITDKLPLKSYIQVIKPINFSFKI